MNLFKYLVGFSALLVAGCAAFFSVKGIATLFSGAFIASLIMAGSLEFGKLVAVSYLHRCWEECSRLLKWYLSIAVFVLMLITSLGIFGFLSSAYQDSALSHEIHLSKIENIENQKSMVIDEIKMLNDRIVVLNDARKGQEQRLNEITGQIGKTMTAKSAQALQESTQKLIEESSADISKAQDKLDTLSSTKISLEEKIMDIKINNEGSKDIQTFEFVANEFGSSLDSVAKWFIIVIIFVFDPLAVALVLAYNSMVLKEKPTTVVINDEPKIDNTPSEIKRQLMKMKNIKVKSGEIKDSEGNVIAET
jgi:hypothetical protein